MLIDALEPHEKDQRKKRYIVFCWPPFRVVAWPESKQFEEIDQRFKFTLLKKNFKVVWAIDRETAKKTIIQELVEELTEQLNNKEK